MGENTMKSSIPLYIIILLLICVLAALFVGAPGMRGPVKMSGDLRAAFMDFDAVASVLIDKNGNTRFVSPNGQRPVKECSVGNSPIKPRCKGFGIDGTVEEIRSVILMRTTGSDCIVSYDERGAPTMICW